MLQNVDVVPKYIIDGHVHSADDEAAASCYAAPMLTLGCSCAAESHVASIPSSDANPPPLGYVRFHGDVGQTSESMTESEQWLHIGLQLGKEREFKDSLRYKTFKLRSRKG